MKYPIHRLRKEAQKSTRRLGALTHIALLAIVLALSQALFAQQDADKPCAKPACGAEIADIKTALAADDLEIPKVDVRIEAIQHEQKTIQIDVEKFRKDRLQYKLDCTGIEVSSPAERSAYLERMHCADRNRDLNIRLPKVNADNLRTSELSGQIQIALGERKKLLVKKQDDATRLTVLELKAINAAVADLQMRASASTACEKIADLELSVCCHQIVWDGKDPGLCDVSLIYEAFVTYGAFGARVVVPKQRTK